MWPLESTLYGGLMAIISSTSTLAFCDSRLYQVLTNANGSTNQRLLIFSWWTLTLRILSSDCQRLRRASMGSDVGVTSSRANVCKSFCRATGFQVFFFDFVDGDFDADACTDINLNLEVPANVVGDSIHWLSLIAAFQSFHFQFLSVLRNMATK